MSATQSTSDSHTAPQSPAAPESDLKILFVDLDGTLIKTDLFGECLLRAFLGSPQQALQLTQAATRGRATLKQATAELVRPKVATLPYRKAAVDLISDLRSKGWTVVLASATHQTWAEQIAKHLELFDDVLASDGTRNLKGKRKLAEIQAYCQQHGFQNFAYIGDSSADFPIWAEATQAYTVRTNTAVVNKLQRTHKCALVLDEPISNGNAIWNTMRPWQWLKNTLVFVPLLLGHQFTQIPSVIAAILAMITMSMCASAVYILNDLLDIESDRQHPQKRFRPLAAGTLLPGKAALLFCSLLGGSILLALTTLPIGFTAILVSYFAMSTLYTVRLKREAIADVIVLAGLYTLRIYAGGIAVNITVSDWLFTLSVFLFTSLAFAKRHAELMRLESEGHFRACGRGYVVTDLPLIQTLGAVSGYLSVLVFALYTQADTTRAVYTNATALWLICPIALFWVSRFWFIAIRGQLHEDPVVFALKDRLSLILALTVAILLYIAANAGAVPTAADADLRPGNASVGRCDGTRQDRKVAELPQRRFARCQSRNLCETA